MTCELASEFNRVLGSIPNIRTQLKREVSAYGVNAVVYTTLQPGGYYETTIKFERAEDLGKSWSDTVTSEVYEEAYAIHHEWIRDFAQYVLEHIPTRTCCTCGGEMDMVTDTCIPLSPCYNVSQDLCDGCFESLKNDERNYYVASFASEEHTDFTWSDCDRCQSTLGGSRWLYSSAVYSKQGSKLVGIFFSTCCYDCRDEMTE